jgi:hypothetical protein
MKKKGGGQRQGQGEKAQAVWFFGFSVKEQQKAHTSNATKSLLMRP